MKRLLLLCMSLAWMGCEQPDPISVPKPKPEPKEKGALVSASVETLNDSLVPNEPIQLIPKLVFEGDIDSALIKYNWAVTYNGAPVDIKEAAKKLLNWIPTLPGKYTAHVTIQYGDKSLDVIVILIILQAPNPDPIPKPIPDPGAVDGAKRLAWIRNSMNGSWTGTVTTPWVAPYRVDVHFRANGTYSDYSLQPDICPSALYYGTNEDSPMKTFLLDDLKASGEIQVVFEVGTTTIDEIRHVKIGPDAKTLSLEMWHFGTYGPVRLELTRTP